MDKESIYLLKKLDCNCNDCFFFKRDMKRTEEQHIHRSLVPQAGKVHYGQCTKFDKEVAEMANVCLIYTQKCFVHRNDANLIKSQLWTLTLVKLSKMPLL